MIVDDATFCEDAYKLTQHYVFWVNFPPSIVTKKYSDNPLRPFSHLRSLPNTGYLRFLQVFQEKSV